MLCDRIEVNFGLFFCCGEGKFVDIVWGWVYLLFVKFGWINIIDLFCFCYKRILLIFGFCLCMILILFVR